MKAIKLVAVVLVTVLFANPEAQAILLESTVIKGKVHSFDTKTVTLIDDNKQKIKISRSELPKNMKVSGGEKISVSRKVKPRDLAITNLPYKLKSLKGLKKEGIKKLLFSYLVFLHHNDQIMVHEDGYKSVGVEGETSMNILDLFIRTAYSDDPAFRCFWGGWPTTIRNGGNCREPYSRSNTAVTEESSPLKYHSCGGGNDVYRCNPVVFGPATQFMTESESGSLGGRSRATGQTGTFIRRTPQADAHKGICVVASARTVVDRCTKASAHNFENIVAQLTDEPANSEHRQAFVQFAESVAAFCANGRNSANAACANLRGRLGAIQLALTPEANRPEGISSCTVSSTEDFGHSAGEGESCPERLCALRARCAQGASADFNIPVTAVCGCKVLGGDGAAPTTPPSSAQVLSCINDRSIAVLNRANGNFFQSTPGGQVLEQ